MITENKIAEIFCLADARNFQSEFSPSNMFSLRASAGKGYRSPHALAENFTLLAGGRTIIVEENLTNYRMRNPVISADNPSSQSFDATQNWGPIDGAMAYVGIRLKFEQYKDFVAAFKKIGYEIEPKQK